MREQKLKVYRFDTKIRNKESHKTIEEQFRVVAYNIKEAKELFELAFDYGTISKHWELIEISEIKMVTSEKWNPLYMKHYYEMFMEFKKNVQEEE